ncbi:MAG: hypothetical protein IPL77_03445 [Flavobacteriales bacterium]|nr:hypothetical protein [Flavobacteriales bacterium]
MPYPEIREVVNFNFASGYLGKVKGNLLETTNGAWAVLGGKAGVTENNLLLIAQISTTGTLSFLLNLQIETPEHEPVKYVARDPDRTKCFTKDWPTVSTVSRRPPESDPRIARTYALSAKHHCSSPIPTRESRLCAFPAASYVVTDRCVNFLWFLVYACSGVVYPKAAEW